MKYFKNIIPVFFILFLVTFNLAGATDYSSGGFILRDPIMSDFGSRATSTSFEQLNAGGQTVTGESTSTSFILKSGFLYYDEFAPKSQNWRWYRDFPNETPTAAAADENVAPTTIGQRETLKLRLTIKETSGNGYLNMKYKLQFSEFSNFSVVNDVAEIGDCTRLSLWCYADGGGADNALITTKTLSDADPCAGSIGDGCGTHNESGTSLSTYNHKKYAASEFEFTIKTWGAEMNKTYFFRAFDMVHNMPVQVNNSETYPSLVMAGAELTFTINGVDANTMTGGVVTDATTTPTNVDFGHLPFGSQVEAAQRLEVSTNAVEGYQIFVFQTQGFLGPGSSQISPVSATNDSPAPWAVPGGQTGAYGYHTDDATLAGGSTRFALDNTYAKFESIAKEISYNSGPVANDSTDMVYKVQVSNQQLPGDYTTGLVYVIVPVF